MMYQNKSCSEKSILTVKKYSYTVFIFDMNTQVESKYEIWARKQQEKQAAEREKFLETMVDDGKGGQITYRQYVENCKSYTDPEEQELCRQYHDKDRVMPHTNVYGIRTDAIAKRNDPKHPEYKTEDEAKLQDTVLDCNDENMFDAAKSWLKQSTAGFREMLSFDVDGVMAKYVGACSSTKNFKLGKWLGSHNQQIVETFMELVTEAMRNIYVADLRKIPAVHEEIYKRFCNKKCTLSTCNIQMVQSTKRAAKELKLRHQIIIATEIVKSIFVQELLNLKQHPKVLEIKRVNEFHFDDPRYDDVKARAKGFDRRRQYENFEDEVKTFIDYFEIVFGNKTVVESFNMQPAMSLSMPKIYF